MTDTPSNPVPPDSGKLRKFFPLTPELAKELRAIEHMPAGAWRLWSFLATLDPYGSDYLELPELVDILAECNISKATFYRAIALFHEHALFDLQPTKMYILNLRGQRIVSKLRHPSQNCTPPSQNCNPQSQSCENQEATTPMPLSNERTNCSRKDLKNNRTVPPIPPCSHKGINREESGTGGLDPLKQDIERLSALIDAVGVRPNKTIQTALAELMVQQGAVAATRAVENSLSALQEQREKGTVRNPGGFLIAALRRSFTANHAKREARERKRPPDPPSFNQVSAAVNEAIRRGDRAFALARLQQLWADGYHDLIEELCITWKRDWGFQLTNEGVSDGN